MGGEDEAAHPVTQPPLLTETEGSLIGKFRPHWEFMGRVYAGTSGWAYSSWKPDFYPPKLASTKFLGHYAERLNSVEVNYTFRRFPTESLLEKWVAATPAGFQFAIKANQRITHIKRLKDTEELVSRFLSSLRILRHAKRMGPLLVQLPPLFKSDPQRLKDFLKNWPRSLRCAMEFRHKSWFNEEVYGILREFNAALCQAESEKLETPDVQTADFDYLRFQRERYSAATLQKITQKTAELSSHGDVYLYFKHEDTPAGAFRAETLLQSIQKQAGDRSTAVPIPTARARTRPPASP